MKEKLKVTWEVFLKALGCKPYQVAQFERMYDIHKSQQLSDRVTQIEKVKHHDNNTA